MDKSTPIILTMLRQIRLIKFISRNEWRWIWFTRSSIAVKTIRSDELPSFVCLVSPSLPSIWFKKLRESFFLSPKSLKYWWYRWMKPTLLSTTYPCLNPKFSLDRWTLVKTDVNEYVTHFGPCLSLCDVRTPTVQSIMLSLLNMSLFFLSCLSILGQHSFTPF